MYGHAIETCYRLNNKRNAEFNQQLPANYPKHNTSVAFRESKKVMMLECKIGPENHDYHLYDNDFLISQKEPLEHWRGSTEKPILIPCSNSPSLGAEKVPSPIYENMGDNDPLYLDSSDEEDENPKMISAKTESEDYVDMYLDKPEKFDNENLKNYLGLDQYLEQIYVN